MSTEKERSGVLASFRKELERNTVRARNGIKWFRGAEFAPLHPTPSDVVWSEGKAELRHYRRDTPARLGPPVVAFLGLVGNSYVFDLYKGGSIVQMLMDWGFDAFVMDWGIADELDSNNTLETYMKHYLPQAMQAVADVTGHEDAHFFCYCMGGVMLVHALAGKAPISARSVVTLGSPFDWRHLGATIDLIRDGRIKLETVIDDTGNVPGPLLVQAFKRLKPTADLVNYANLWENLWNDKYVEGYQAIGRFLTSHGPMPGALMRQVTQQWMIDNAFMNDSLRFAGRNASLSNVRCPLLAVIADRDDIAPLESTLPIADLLPQAEVEVMRVDAGHVSLFAGRDAVKTVMPGIFEWLEGHSEEYE
jgi:polyhydroxyalkanoate synthase